MTEEGTPQGGVISPLLANIALHGMETAIREKYPSTTNGRIRKAKSKYGRKDISTPILIRYADDFVILCDELIIVEECKTIISEWLEKLGLEVKPNKTRMCHTLNELEKEKAGFKFLGLEIQQFQVGKHQSIENAGVKLEHTTIIRPSKESLTRHYRKLADWCQKMMAVSQKELIGRLNPIIRGWCNYHSPWNSKEVFSKLDYLIWNRLWRWAKRRHPNKGKKWIARKYWRTINNNNWTFSTLREGKNPLTLLRHSEVPTGTNWVKVKGERSPYDGDKIYWGKRLGDKYQTLDSQKARLLKKQKGKCAHCGQTFKPEDNLEKHHLEAKAKGGNNSDKNLILVHLHCHDQIHGNINP